ncbi:MAG: dephospho-CoA kinase [Flavobacteriaceae bacterium]|nr:dephospho-CoA kinase [Flavobacteriaceae bacterium]
MKVIAITGGIGSGKSYVSNFFSELKIPIYDSDSRAKFLMNNNKTIIKKVVESLGSQSYKNGHTDKSYISKSIFQNSNNLKLLNSIIHPAVLKDFNNWLSLQTSRYVIYESALIFKNQYQNRFDSVILVLSSDENRITRLKKRGLSLNMIKRIMKVQLSNPEMIALSNFIIKNNNSTDIKAEVLNLHKLFSSQENK